MKKRLEGIKKLVDDLMKRNQALETVQEREKHGFHIIYGIQVNLKCLQAQVNNCDLFS